MISEERAIAFADRLKLAPWLYRQLLYRQPGKGALNDMRTRIQLILIVQMQTYRHYLVLGN